LITVGFHFRAHLQEGKFYLTDRRSSNGTMVYLQDPFPLPYQHSLKLRMGRTTLSLQAKRSWTSSLRSMLGAPLPHSETASPTPEEVQELLATCTASMGAGGSGGNGGEYVDGTQHGSSPTKDEAMSPHGSDEVLEQQARVEAEHQQQHQQQRSHQAQRREAAEGADSGTGAGLGAAGRSPYSPAFPFVAGERDPSVRSNNSAGNTSFQSLNSSMTGVTGLTSMVPTSLGLSSMRLRASQQVHPGVGGAVTAEDAGHEEEDEEVRRAIELSLMELAQQQQRQEQAALDGQQQQRGEASGSAGLPPLGKVTNSGSNPRSGSSSPLAAPGTAVISKSPSKALLDYSQPELLCDSLDEDQVTSAVLQ
jgi:hypothetical protein